MINRIKIYTTVLTIMMLACSCDMSNDADEVLNPGMDVSYGTVVSYSGEKGVLQPDDYYIVRDDAGQMLIEHDLSGYSSLRDGQRIVFSYNILQSFYSEDKYHHRIRLFAVRDVPSKDLVKRTDALVNEGLQTEWIMDPVSLDEAWFGGKYLNIIYKVYTRDPAKESLINLVLEDIYTEEGKVSLTLSHNAYGELPTAEDNSGFQLAQHVMSFDISQVIPEGATSVRVKFTWTEFGSDWNETVIKYMEGDFSLNLDKYGLDYVKTDRSDIYQLNIL